MTISQKQAGAIEEIIRSKLRELNWSITEFSRRLQVSRLTVYNLLNGVGSMNMFRRVSRELRIPLHRLLDDQQDIPNRENRIAQAYQSADARIQKAIDILLDIHGS